VRQGFFITTTDTGVGKTVFTAALAERLRGEGRAVIAMKPIATGVAGAGVSSDTLFLECAAQSGESPERLTPLAFRAPLAPAVAARLEGRAIDLAALAEHCRSVAARYEVTLVEGVGGLLVPLTDGACVADFAKELGLPLIVVARPGLGTLNHTALTVESARGRGLAVAGIVISGWPEEPGLAEETNLDELPRLTGLPLLACLPLSEGLDTDRGERGAGWPRLVAAIEPGRFIRGAKSGT